MKADEVIFSLDSTFNDKRLGDMTFYEVRAVAFQWIMVKKKCKRMVILQKKDGEEKVVFVFTKEDFKWA